MYSHNIGHLCSDHLDDTWEKNVLKTKSAMLLGIVFGILSVSILTGIQKQVKQSEEIERVVPKQDNEWSFALFSKKKTTHYLTLRFTVWFYKACF